MAYDLEKPARTSGSLVAGDDRGASHKRRGGPALRVVGVYGFLSLLALVSVWPHFLFEAADHFSDALSLLHVGDRSSTPDGSADDTPLECFQVAQPVLTPGKDGQPCSLIMMDHVFGFSYGEPFTSNYTPPSCDFNRVVINFTVVSQGRQFDRLALMYLNDTEVWRTSTAEPTRPPGISWTYMKDMTQYLSLWRQPQTLIFDLGNLIDDKYTGTFNTTLTASFFTVVSDNEAPGPADLVIPISARRGSARAASAFTLPSDNATSTISFPKNANRAAFTISACGQAAEEFWWSNVLESDVYTFNGTAGPLAGLSPFREVQLLIDGRLAGIDWPFPVVFTGGVVPGLHRPIVGLQAFDLREHEIDITPWLPMLCDGGEHTFTIVIAGLNDDREAGPLLTSSVGDSWVVTGKLFVWLDDSDSVTTGTPPTIEFMRPGITVSRIGPTQNSTGSNETLAFNTTVRRSLTVDAVVNSQHRRGRARWSQVMSYSNQAAISNFGFDQSNTFLIEGLDAATSPSNSYESRYRYPLQCASSYAVDPAQKNLTLAATLHQGLEVHSRGHPVFPTGLEAFWRVSGQQRHLAASSLVTWRDGTARFAQTGDGKNSSGYGSTNQVFRFEEMGESALLRTPSLLYFRNVTAVNDSVIFDRELLWDGGGGGGVERTSPTQATMGFAGGQLQRQQVQEADFAVRGPRQFLV